MRCQSGGDPGPQRDRFRGARYGTFAPGSGEHGTYDPGGGNVSGGPNNYWTDTLRSFVNENKWNHKEVKVTTHTAVHSRIRESTEVLVYNYEIEKTLF